MGKAIMIQGAGSNVGKSMLVAGLCRAYTRRGLSVLPFKPQNMSNNAAVTEDGGEIGRAQALQAVAAGVAAHTDMNPVLLKPESETGAQVIVHGQRFATVKARDYAKLKPKLMPQVIESFDRLRRSCDLVIVEGAGSPAETNLRDGDIANMGFAAAANIPVILTGDIDRGGVIAQIVGTSVVLPSEDRNRIKGFIINKFRGDPTLFEAGLAEISGRTDWGAIGVVPWFKEAHKLPAEDIMDIRVSHGDGFKIAVPKLSRIANFDDLDPLSQEPNVSIIMVEAGKPLPGDADLVLIPGSKSTIADLRFFRAQGWDIDLAAHIRRGGHVLGICGGYQMLGTEIRDPDGIEGMPGHIEGLGHLDVVTVMRPEKHLAEISATYLPTGTPLKGYEIHIGETTGADCDRAWLSIAGATAGAASSDSRVAGCYVHGLFTSDAFRNIYLSQLGAQSSNQCYDGTVDKTLDALADHLEQTLDLDRLLEIAN